MADLKDTMQNQAEESEEEYNKLKTKLENEIRRLVTLHKNEFNKMKTELTEEIVTLATCHRKEIRKLNRDFEEKEDLWSGKNRGLEEKCGLQKEVQDMKTKLNHTNELSKQLKSLTDLREKIEHLESELSQKSKTICKCHLTLPENVNISNSSVLSVSNNIVYCSFSSGHNIRRKRTTKNRKVYASIISILTESRGFIRFDESTGADTILLIVAILPSKLLERLIRYCHSLGVEPLVEELEMALGIGARVIRVNNRDLHTFSLDLNTTDIVTSCQQEANLIRIIFASKSKQIFKISKLLILRGLIFYSAFTSLSHWMLGCSRHLIKYYSH